MSFKRLPNLSEILQYKNVKVIRTFQKLHKIDNSEAELIFEDMLRWLWLCKMHDSKLKKNPNITPTKLDLYSPMKEIDEMWHSFILYTKDYEFFCKKYLGTFIHHEPNISISDFDTVEKNVVDVQTLMETLHFILENLGDLVLIRWFRKHET